MYIWTASIDTSSLVQQSSSSSSRKYFFFVEHTLNKKDFWKKRNAPFFSFLQPSEIFINKRVCFEKDDKKIKERKKRRNMKKEKIHAKMKERSG